MPSTSQSKIRALKAFLLCRWNGEAPLATVFWRDMIVAGSAINIVTTAAAIALVAAEAPIAIAILVFFVSLPCNLFLFVSVWRSAEKAADQSAWAAQLCGVLWLVAVTAL